jgi:hypothetical protein
MAANDASLDFVFSPTTGVEVVGRLVEEEDRLVDGDTCSLARSSSESAFLPLLGRHGFVFFSAFFLFLEGVSDFLDFYININKDGDLNMYNSIKT